MFGNNLKSQDIRNFVHFGFAGMHYCVNAQTMQFSTEQDQLYYKNITTTITTI